MPCSESKYEPRPEGRCVSRKRTRGAVLIELTLTLVPYLFLTLGSIEFMWYFHVRQSLSKAADVAVREMVVDHDEDDYNGSNPARLVPYKAKAIIYAKNCLTNMGFSSAFIDDVVFEIEFIQHLDTGDRDYPSGGFPQSNKMRLVGAKLTIPWENAMMFGNIVSNFLGLVLDTPSEIVVISFRFKKWN